MKKFLLMLYFDSIYQFNMSNYSQIFIYLCNFQKLGISFIFLFTQLFVDFDEVLSIYWIQESALTMFYDKFRRFFLSNCFALDCDSELKFKFIGILRIVFLCQFFCFCGCFVKNALEKNLSSKCSIDNMRCLVNFLD